MSEGALLPIVVALSRRRGSANASTELPGEVDLEEGEESRDRLALIGFWLLRTMPRLAAAGVCDPRRSMT